MIRLCLEIEESVERFIIYFSHVALPSGSWGTEMLRLGTTRSYGFGYGEMFYEMKTCLVSGGGEAYNS